MQGKLMKTFKQFINEKQVTNKQALYIACPFVKSQVKVLYERFPIDDMKEPELNPHMTLFYSPNANGYEKQDILDFLGESLKDVEFEGQLTKYKVFKNTEDGTSDCLVVNIEVEDKLKHLRKTIVDYLKNNVDNLEITYPVWNPHMTIGYYEIGQIPKYDKFDPIDITLTNFFCK